MWLRQFIALKERTRENITNAGYFQADKHTVLLNNRLRGKDEAIKLQLRCHCELLSLNSQLQEEETIGQKTIDCSISLHSVKEKAKHIIHSSSLNLWTRIPLILTLCAKCFSINSGFISALAVYFFFRFPIFFFKKTGKGTPFKTLMPRNDE